MQIGVISIHHENATVSQREKCHLTEAAQAHFLNALIQEGLLEATLLSTCGRFEVYYVTRKDDFDEQTAGLLEKLSTLVPASLWDKKQGKQAVEHLFRVSTGMASAVLGEDQILGQVKNALVFSNECGTSGKILNKIIRDAITFSKRVKTELKISEVPLSLSYIAIKKAKAHMTFDAHTRITMVGMGKMGKLAIHYLLEEPFESLYICVRHPQKLPEDLLTHPRVHIAPFEDRYTYVANSHLVVSSTGAPHTVIRMPYFKTAVKQPLIIDLAVPRDVCNAVYEDPAVTVWDVDGLKETSSENQAKRAELVRQVDEWLENESELSYRWIEATKVDDVLKGWHRDIDLITQAAIEQSGIGKQNPSTLTPETLEKILTSALKKMIKKPLENLKQMDNTVKREQSVQLLKELFEYDA